MRYKRGGVVYIKGKESLFEFHEIIYVFTELSSRKLLRLIECLKIHLEVPNAIYWIRSHEDVPKSADGNLEIEDMQ